MTKLVKVQTISGAEAEMYRIFFESIGLGVTIIRESAGVTYGLTVGLMGEAHIYACEEDVPKVEEALRKLEAGEYSLDEDDSNDDQLEDTDPDLQE